MAPWDRSRRAEALNGALLLLSFLSLIACEPFGPIESVILSGPESGFNAETPLLVSPSLLDFGEVVVNDLASSAVPHQEVLVTNLGQQEVPVYGYADISGGDFYVDAAPYFTLLPGEGAVLPVFFSPRTDQHYDASFSIVGGTTPVQVTGHGRAPVVEVVTDEPVGVAVGCTETFLATVSNQGSEPLQVDSIGLRDGEDYEIVDLPPLPAVLAPGEHLSVSLRFDHVFSWTDPSEQEDALIVQSNDPLMPEAWAVFDIQPIRGSEVNKELNYYPDTQTDLMIMVDNTGVMSSRISLAEDAFPVLVETLLDANVDLHATVVTGASSCSAGIITSDAGETAVTDFLVSGLSGMSGSGSSALLSHAALAIEESVTGGCLEGLLRKGALLHVVVISGGDEQSSLTSGQLVEMLHGGAPLSDALIISAIVGTDPGGCMGLTYGGSYLNAARLTNGIQASACSDDWSPAMEELALLSAQRAEGGMSMSLDPLPVAQTLRVTVNGGEYIHWRFDEETASLIFPKEQAPEVGSMVEVSYLMSDECGE